LSGPKAKTNPSCIFRCCLHSFFTVESNGRLEQDLLQTGLRIDRKQALWWAGKDHHQLTGSRASPAQTPANALESLLKGWAWFVMPAAQPVVPGVNPCTAESSWPSPGEKRNGSLFAWKSYLWLSQERTFDPQNEAVPIHLSRTLILEHNDGRALCQPPSCASCCTESNPGSWGKKGTGKENSRTESCTIRSEQQAADSAFLLYLLPSTARRREKGR